MTEQVPARYVSATDREAFADAVADMLAGIGPALLPVAGPELPAETNPTVPAGVDVVIETSGSSGIPKRIAHSRHALLHSARATERVLGGPGTWLSALPGNYIAGLQVLVRSHLAGTTPAYLPPGPFDPAVFEAHARLMFTRALGRRYVSLVPAQVQRVLDHSDVLAEFDAVLVGGQAIPEPLRERARAAGVTLVRTYGASETGGGCVYDGVPLPGVSAAIIAGEIRLSGPLLALGYLAADGTWDSARTDAAFVEATDGFERALRTGDTGEIVDGVLAVHGRIDNVLISGGINVSLDRIDQVVRAAGLEDAVAVAASDERWGQVPVVFTAQRDPDPEGRLERLRAACAAQIGREARPRAIIELAQMPLLASGKPDRRALAARI
ncbi:O-succinylbenzoic acid--CoA ligase [Mycetocola sp. BIGb0189]|uniref:AMP-binding protein n=1 Tax=Mycetocola sp. BIGb0189 TaxID=2940604 RepID=UPI002168B9D2|nr:AMP-binding protein [Mycetocola sp. BIGb0189]MCS4276391.1 O-succinylbenzoic acid--CoA ligase [Mycetocola sp. BIGb0189]